MGLSDGRKTLTHLLHTSNLARNYIKVGKVSKR